MFHWTDSKIRVHAFYCVLALTLTSLLQRTLHQKGHDLSMARMLQLLAGDALLCGFGAEITKSPALSLVSTQPPDFLKPAVVFDGAGACAVPSKQEAVVP